MGRLRPFRSTARINRVMGDPAYDRRRPNRGGGDPYDTKYHPYFRGKTPSLFAPPAMAHTATCGPFVTVPIDGAR